MNITRKETAGLLFLTFVASIGIFVRSSLFAWDGYATAACIRHGWCHTLGWQDAAVFLFNFFPDSLLFFKLLMFASLFLSLLPIFLIVKERFDRNYAFYSVFLLLALSPTLVYGFAKFENELFAFPLIAWGIYFLAHKNWLKSVLFFVSSFFFWAWPGYFRNANFLSPGPTIEQMPFAGVLDVWLLLPFIFFIPLIEDRYLRNLGLVFVGFFLWNSKLFLFMFFFLGLAIPITLKSVAKLSNHKHFSLISVNFILILAFFCMVGVNCGLIIQQPTPTQLYIVEKAVLLSEENNFNLYNDWEYGYWLWYAGFQTKNHPGSGGQINFVEIREEEIEKPFYVLTNEEPLGQGCVQVVQQISYFGRKITLWECT